MTIGVQRFLANHRNAIRAAVLAATAVLPHEAIFRTSTVRAGNGRVKLAGAYTGHEDATFDIEIAAGGTTPRVSAPVFAGVGSGELTELAVDPGTSEQTFTVRLASLGTDTTKAGLALGPVVIQAKTPGAGGNAIYLRVDESALVYTDADFALLDPWPAGVTFQEGEQWSFDSQPLLASGALAPGTKRFQIGEDLQIFRPYRKFESGKWRYYLTPAPERDLPRGARLREVTGARTVTVSDGVTTESYPGIVTLYDLLAALGASDLVEVAGVVANDAAPGGQAAVDLPLKTMAYRLPVQNSGSANVRGLEDVTVAPTAATENVTIECVDPGQLGREKWRVSGDVSGELAQAITAVPYSAPRFGFTIPERLPPPGVNEASFVVQEIDYQPRGESEIEPPICVESLTLGAAAQSKTITLIYKARPPGGDCECLDMPAGAIDFDCLGLTEEGAIMSGISAAYSKRLTDVGRWYAEFCKTNTQIEAGGEVRSAVHDLDYARRTRDVLYSVLADLYSDDATRSWPAWTAESPRALDALGEPAVRNGFRYHVDVNGTTGASEPTWPTTIGNTVVDGTVTWRCVGKVPEQAFDDLMVTVKADAALIDTMGGLGSIAESATEHDPIEADASFTAGNFYRQHGLLLKCIISGGFSLGSAGPINVPVTTRGAIAECGQAPGQAYFIVIGSLTGHAEDINSIANVEAGYSAAIDDYVARYRAGADNVRAEAGIVKKSDAGTLGAECWRDHGGSFWWEVNGKTYLPAFSNEVYYSAKRRFDAAARRWVIEPTHEFAFQINVKCPEHLKAGDTITLAIGDTGPRGYQAGDRMVLPIIAAQDAFLAGGVTGDDTHTWRVHGTVDGQLADYPVVHGSEASYNDGGLQFKILRGGIPYGLGDTWTFAVEAGRFRWRKNAGAWSAFADIPAAPAALSDGVSAEFTPGAAPSFSAGDAYGFLAEQRNAASHVAAPDDDAWAWTGSGVILTAHLGAPTVINALALARHSLPPGATVTIEGSDDDGATWPLAQALTWREGVMAALLATPWTVDAVRLVVANAAGAAIGYWYAGAALAFAKSSDKADMTVHYRLDRGETAGIFTGYGQGAELEWDTWLPQADIDALLAMVKHVKRQHDEPLIFIPHHLHTDEARLVTVNADTLVLNERGRWQPNDKNHRAASTRLTLDAFIE